MDSSHLNIVADENIPYVQEVFGPLGHVRLVSGRTITPSIIKDANVLLVRSITKVNRELLHNSPISFVGTATAGLDHIDVEYLANCGIPLASAQGGNANSVAEYVTTAMVILADKQGVDLAEKSIGIIGVGHIGRLVKSKAEALGMRVVLNDPPQALATQDPIYRTLEEVLECDVVTLHVPLTFEGPYRTHHLFNHETLAHLRPSSIFINTSRGEVVDTPSLINLLKRNSNRAVVLDVWESEPDINWEMFKLVNLGTPHIAGYSLDGKARGTSLIYQSLCQHLGITPSWTPSQSLPPPAFSQIEIDTKVESTPSSLTNLITSIYNLKADHTRLAGLLQLPPEHRPLEFDRLRQSYPVRREFYNTSVKIVNQNEKLQRQIKGLGFNIGN